MIPPSNGTPPTTDGQIQLYETPQKEGIHSWYKPNRRAIYINGQVTSGQRHMECAQAVSLLQMCPVIGVFNRSDSDAWYSVIFDTLQSIGDKAQFHSPWSGGPQRYFQRSLHHQETLQHGALDHSQAMEELLRRNAATLETFRLLRSGEIPPGTPIFAHSQGNLILSNALTALSIVDGPQAIRGLEVHSYGCPTIFWPAGITQYDNAFTGDPVALLNPILNFKISKVGLPTGIMPWGFVSHDFLLYMKDESRFVINRFRWGGWGMTLHMNEEGLADALVRMEDNEPRIRAVFERLDQHFNSDADDVAYAYVTKMRTPANEPILRSMRAAPLIRLLIKVLEEGWTSRKERDCINYLKGL